MFIRLQTRLTLIFILLAIVPLLTVSFIISQRSTATLERSALVSLEQVTQRVASESGAFIAAQVDELQLIANVNDLQNPTDRAEIETLLFLKNVYREIAIITPAGQEVAYFARNLAAERTIYQQTDDLIQAALTGGEVVYSDIFFDEIAREPLMQVVFPILNVQTGEPAYVLTALFSFRPVWDILRNPELSTSFEAYLLTPEYQVIAHRDPSVVFSETRIELPGDSGRFEFNGVTQLFAQSPLQLGDRTITVVAQQPVEEALALERENRQIVTLLTIGALLLAIGLVVIVVRQVIRPITALADVAQRIRSGDLTARTTVTSRDEVGLLASSFNAMAGQLAGMVDSLEQQVNQRTVALQDALKDVEDRAAQQAELLAQIELQREAIRELSLPILPVDQATLVLPLIGAFDSARLNEVQQRVLYALESSATQRLILDVTGVPVIDSQVAKGLLGVVQAARMLGTDVYLVGIRPEVAQTIVGLGLDFKGMSVFSTLESALAASRKRSLTSRLATAAR